VFERNEGVSSFVKDHRTRFESWRETLRAPIEQRVPAIEQGLRDGVL
jgi:hypothetical protein